MTKVSCAALALIAIAGLVLFAVYSRAKSPAIKDYKNTTYVIDDKPVTLVNGVSEVEVAPGSTSKVVTRYFGNDAKGDLNGDGTVASATPPAA